MSQEINRQELITQLRRLFGFQGGTGFELGELVMPVASLANLDDPPFHSKKGGSASVGQGPIAAQFPYLGLLCPLLASPSLRAVVRRVGYSSNTLQQISLKVLAYPAVIALITGGGSFPVATSWDSLPGGGIVRPECITWNGSDVDTVGGTADGYSLIMPANTPVQVDHPFVLAPGNMLLLQGTVLNTSLNGAFLWDEYYLG